MQTTYREDWLMAQIKLLAAAIAKTVFRKDAVQYEIADPSDKSETDELHLHLRALLDGGHINEAEDTLFAALRPGDKTLLLLAVDFYQRLNALTDEQLLRRSFSRAEIHEGLMEAQRVYGVSLE